MSNQDRSIFAPEVGYAMIELVVSFLVMGIVISVVYASYLFVAKAVVVWQRNMILQNDLHLITQRLAEDLTYTEQLSFESDTAWVLTEASGQIHRYVHRDSTLTRNTVHMHHQDVQVTRFELTPSAGYTEYDPIRMENQGEDEQSLMQITITIDLTGWDTLLTNTTTIALRLSRPWPPLHLTPL
jgi:Tfp pilus assembly protein PilE